MVAETGLAITVSGQMHGPVCYCYSSASKQLPPSLSRTHTHHTRTHTHTQTHSCTRMHTHTYKHAHTHTTDKHTHTHMHAHTQTPTQPHTHTFCTVVQSLFMQQLLFSFLFLASDLSSPGLHGIHRTCTEMAAISWAPAKQCCDHFGGYLKRTV